MHSRAGFTLIEILVVLAIISTLAALVAPNVFQHVGRAKHSAARTQIEMLTTALESYRLDTGEYPDDQDGLRVLRQRPTTGRAAALWMGPYLRRDVPADPWGNAYQYRYRSDSNASTYELVSYGSDGVPGGEGNAADVASW